MSTRLPRGTKHGPLHARVIAIPIYTASLADRMLPVNSRRNTGSRWAIDNTKHPPVEVYSRFPEIE